jgi:hypothetical protein
MDHVKRFGTLATALATVALMGCGGSTSNAHANDPSSNYSDVGRTNPMPTKDPDSLPASPGTNPRSTYLEQYPETPQSEPLPPGATTPGTVDGQRAQPVVTPPNQNSGGGGTQSPGYPVSR